MPLALLFDLDGTLIQSDPLHVAVFIDLFAQHGQQIDEAFYLRHIHGRHNFDIFAKHLPGTNPQAMSDLKEARFRDRLGASLPPMPGAVALLDRAQASGWPIALVTNAPRDNAEAMLRAIGLRDRFDTMIIGDECVRGKPDPAPYLAAMTALDVKPHHCIAFEDSPSGLRSARSAGAYVVGIRSSLPHPRLTEAGAHVSITDYTDPALPDILATQQGACAT